MDQKEKDFLDVCNSLNHLAILKRQTLEKEQIALMARFLLRDLEKEEIIDCCGHFAKRMDRFPDVAHFINMCRPPESIDEIAEREVSSFLELVKQGWDNSKDKFTPIHRIIMEKWSYLDLSHRTNQSEIPKIRISMVFYLKQKLGSTRGVVMELSKKAIHDGKLAASNQGELTYE